MTIRRVVELDWVKRRAKVVASVDGMAQIMWVPMDLVYVNQMEAV